MKSLLIPILFIACLAQAQEPKPNILFIVVDDMNDWVEGFDGHPQTRTPNITTVSEQGTIFYNAYATAPQCGPSRTSFLTGKDVAYTKVDDNTKLQCYPFDENFEVETDNEEYFTIPQYLKDSAGYFTYSIGKVFHCWDDYIEFDAGTTDPCSRGKAWNKYTFADDDVIQNFISTEFNDGVGNVRWGRIDSVYESEMADYIAADSAVAFLEQVATGDGTCGKPFFLALGIRKPHFPTFTPAKYWYNDFYMDDVYSDPFKISYNYPEGSTPYNGIVIPPQTFPERFLDYANLPYGGMALDISDVSDDNFIEYPGSLSPLPVVSDTISDSLRNIIIENSKRANMVNGYLASINFADAQIGKVLEALALNPAVYNNTIIVILGDHGFSLGEKRHWQKHTLWETDIRSGLIIADLRNPINSTCKRMVNFIDIFPTICDMVDLEAPAFSDGSKYLDGRSLMPYLNGSFQNTDRTVLSAISNGKGKPGSCYPHYSMRNNRFHFIKYTVQSGSSIVDCDTVPGAVEEELYDIGRTKETDPYEWNNVAYNPDYAIVKEFLSQWLPLGPMYLQEAVNVTIRGRKNVPCYYSSSNNVKLRVLLSDSMGTTIPNPLAEGYKVRWSNNFNGDEFFGTSYVFNTDAVPTAVFDTSEFVFIYAQIIDTSNNNVVGLDMKKIFINPVNTPVVDFSTYVSDHTLHITDYAMTGSANAHQWLFGDGTTVSQQIPGPHTYDASGTYLVKNRIFHGNDCILITNNSINITEEDFMRYMMPSVQIFPNPASDLITINLKNMVGDVCFNILDLSGKELAKFCDEINSDGNYMLSLEGIPSGIYLLQYEIGSFVGSEKFVVVKN